VLTVASVAYNFATDGRYKSPRALYRGPFASVDGTLLAYRRWGHRGRPIVLLSGFAEPSWVWHGVGRALARRYQVFAVDLPPFGFSERRGPYTIAHWQQLLHGFVARLRLRHAIVVGHSLGAAVAVRFALDRPGDTAGIVLLDGDALPGGGPGWLAHMLVPPWYTSVFRLATSSDWIVRRVVRNAWPHSPPLTRALLAQFEDPFHVAGTDAAYRSLFAHGIQGVSPADLKRLRVRRLVVWGAEDTVDGVNAGRKTAALLRARFVLIPSAGHLSMLAAPAAVAAAIARFARRLSVEN
jgi:pimeloyl-ACP methyl ester carboxylesterase